MRLRVSLLVFAVLGCISVSGCSGKKEPTEKPPVVQEMNIVRPADGANDQSPKN